MKYVVANWKQNKTPEEARRWCEDFRDTLSQNMAGTLAKFIICPSFPMLPVVSEFLTSDNTGSQDVSEYLNGPHTGNVGATQLRDFCRYAIIGHSERAEDRSVVLQKAELCVKSGITPVVCFKSSDEYKVISGVIYVLEDPDNISSNGQYRAKSAAEIKELLSAAREFFGKEAVILYGGSVNEGNSAELSSMEGLNGVLIGNASLDSKIFVQILRDFSL